MPSRRNSSESLGTTKESTLETGSLGLKLFKTLDAHDDIIHSIALDPTGHFFATASRDTSVKLWNMNNGELVHSLEWHERPVLSVAFNPTGTLLVSGGADSTLKLWDVTSGKLLATLRGHRGAVHCVAFDPTGRLIASGSSDATSNSGEYRRGHIETP
jgi:WD40 repeat protein